MSVRMLCANTMQPPPSGCACHPSTGGELSVRMLCANTMQPPVRLRHRVQTRCNRPSVSVLGGELSARMLYANTMQPPRQARRRVQTCHPSPLHRRGIVCPNALCQYGATTPSGFARHPSRGGELFASILEAIYEVQTIVDELHKE